MKEKYALAIDIGASSGRHIVGWFENNELKIKEVFRFENSVKNQDGVLVWDIDGLVRSVKLGIDEALKQFPQISSLGIDTWGVDYVLMKESEALLPCISYRNGSSDELINEVHGRISFAQLYSHTGTQFQRFNTIYQMYRDCKSGKLEKADDFLYIPEYLMYRLCSVKVHEYTNATTSGLVEAKTGQYDRNIIETLGLPNSLFHNLVQPGFVIGKYKGIDCCVCATHDTASAIYSIPMEDDIYISSGTWSIIGVKTDKPLTDENSMNDNFSNEGGVGYNRYLKNIMGMWMINRLRDELCPGMDFEEIVKKAQTSSYIHIVDAQHEMFLAPDSMKEAFDKALIDKGFEKPATQADYFFCAYNSLAKSYAAAVKQIEKNTGKIYKKIYIVGGGAKNQFLNSLTQACTGKTVVALPIEATAIGNLSMQLK